MHSLSRLLRARVGLLCAFERSLVAVLSPGRVLKQIAVLVAVCAVFALGMTLAAPAAADVIFSDTFNRAESNIVGNNWVETEADPDDVAVEENQLRLRDTNPNAAAAQFLISTIGFDNITLSYAWRGNQTEADEDFLLSQWKLSSDTNWITLLTHELNDNESFTLTPASAALGSAASNTTIDFRFILSVNNGNDQARVDNVVLAGNRIPEPATIILLGVGLMGLWGVGRLRSVRQHHEA